MEHQTVLRQVENWGYYLLPRPHPHSPGHSGLLIAIRKTPTLMHFDPEAVQVHLCGGDGAVEMVTLTLNSPFHGSRQVCPGIVMVQDRVNKRADFFTFGGSLAATFSPGETVYSLRSPAPVLAVTEDRRSIPDQLAFETEAMIGAMQARWGTSDKAFDQRLARLEPMQLYMASLHSILSRYEKAPALRQSFPRFYTALIREREWLTRDNQWPAAPQGLELLLAPA